MYNVTSYSLTCQSLICFCVLYQVGCVGSTDRFVVSVLTCPECWLHKKYIALSTSHGRLGRALALAADWHAHNACRQRKPNAAYIHTLFTVSYQCNSENKTIFYNTVIL